jgi:hypothetical protein
MSFSMNPLSLADNLGDELDDGSAILDQAEQVLTTVTYDPSFSASVLGIGDSGKAAVAQVQSLLNQFWALKSANYNDYDDDGQAQWNEQDARAHQIWGRLEERQQGMSDDKATIDAHAKAAAEAYGKSATLAAAANSTALAAQAARYAKAVPQNAAEAKAAFIDTSMSTAFKDSASNLVSAKLFGVPTWVWIAGVAGLVLFVKVKK